MLLDAIGQMGGVEPHAWAATCSFENFLSGIVQRVWQPADTFKLSVGFLVAFGHEMTQRLDIMHRIRSSRLTKEEIAKLSTPPLSGYVNQATLRAFQDV